MEIKWLSFWKLDWTPAQLLNALLYVFDSKPIV